MKELTRLALQRDFLIEILCVAPLQGSPCRDHYFAVQKTFASYDVADWLWFLKGPGRGCSSRCRLSQGSESAVKKLTDKLSVLNCLEIKLMVPTNCKRFATPTEATEDEGACRLTLASSLVAFCGPLGALLALLEFSLGSLGALLGQSWLSFWCFLGAVVACFWPSCDHLWQSCDDLGQSCDDLWQSWGPWGDLGAILGHFGDPGHLGPSWGHLGAILGPS
jgi:hypothetical protein